MKKIEINKEGNLEIVTLDLSINTVLEGNFSLEEKLLKLKEIEDFKRLSVYSEELEWYNKLKEIEDLELKYDNILKELKQENIIEFIKSELELELNSIKVIDEITGEIFKGKIFDCYEDLKRIENIIPWVVKFKGEETDVVRPDKDILLNKKIYNDLIVNERDSKVRSLEDSIADLAKMNSLLFSCISAMYGTMTDTTKAKIDAGTKELIDYSVEKFSGTQTRADRQLMKEGTGLVDKLFDREVQIADIIDEVKGE